MKNLSETRGQFVKTVGALSVATVLVAGCAGGSLTTREKGAGIGALGGAAAGGIIGSAVHHPGAGALIGGALGGVLGALTPAPQPERIPQTPYPAQGYDQRYGGWQDQYGQWHTDAPPAGYRYAYNDVNVNVNRNVNVNNNYFNRFTNNRNLQVNAPRSNEVRAATPQRNESWKGQSTYAGARDAPRVEQHVDRGYGRSTRELPATREPTARDSAARESSAREAATRWVAASSSATASAR